MGISSGGLSFFRFDHRETSLEGLFLLTRYRSDIQEPSYSYIVQLLTRLLWSPFQILCFLLYSRVACSSSWVVPINYLKLIRSDWFASTKAVAFAHTGQTGTLSPVVLSVTFSLFLRNTMGGKGGNFIYPMMLRG